MADNSTQSGADTIATDDVTTLNGGASSGVKVQRVKVGYGDDGTARDVSTLFPLPVNLASSAGNGSQTTQSLTAAGASTLAGTTSTAGSWVLDVGSMGNASFHLLATAFVGTVVFEQSFDPAGANGTWAPVPTIPEDGSTPASSTLVISTAVAYVRQFTQGMFGARLFRVRVSAYTSGTLVALGSAGPGWYEGQPVLAPSAANIGALYPTPTYTIGTATGTTAATTGQVGRVVRANANVAQTTAATLIAAPAAGTRLYVTNITCANEGATLTVLRLFAGSLPAAAGAVAVINDAYDFPIAASGGGATVNFPPGAPWALPVATALSFAVTVATTWDVTISYYVAA